MHVFNFFFPSPLFLSRRLPQGIQESHWSPAGQVEKKSQREGLSEQKEKYIHIFESIK